MRISDVLRELHDEFPSVSHSKLRFLEEQGLIEPVRTAAGYRQYSRADVERLRFVLTQQRDHYLPLRVIRERLDELDSGRGAPAVPAPRAVGAARAQAPQGPTLDEVAERGAVSRELVDDLVTAGLLRPTSAGRLDPRSVEVVTLAASLAEHGVEARHLRSLRSSADRHVDLVDQIVAPLRSQQAVSARAHAGALAVDLGELLARLHTTWVRAGVSDLAP
jgi:DNA-binding transcriptional MerR regulator